MIPLRLAARALIAAAALILAPMALRAQGALDIVEGAGRLVQLPRDAASVFIGDPQVADVQAVSPRSLYLAGIAPGRTNILALDFEDNLIASYDVIVVADNAEAAAIIRDAAPGVGLRSAGNVAIIYGGGGGVDELVATLDAQRALEAEGRVVVDRTEVLGGTQVSIRVRFVEASRSDLNQLGLDLSALGTGGTAVRIVSGGGFAGDFLSGDRAAGGGLSAGVGGEVGDADVDALLTALERRGIVQILSEPTLTTTSGVRASFRAGGEFAFPVPQGDGVVAADFRQFGVSIDFLPTVLPNGRIALEVAPEVSFIDPDVGVSVEGFQVPSLSVRSVETTVEVGSGQTFAIAGLYEQFASDGSEGIPGLASNPITGGLFGTRTQRREERELVIFITPYLAEASDAAAPNRLPARSVASTVGFILE